MYWKGLEVKEMTLGDIARLYSLALASAADKKNAREYMKRMYLTMIPGPKPLKWRLTPWYYHFKNINEILKTMGLVGEKNEDETKNPKEDIRLLSSYFSVNLGGTPKQHEENIRLKDVKPLATEILLNKSKQAEAMIRAHHDPADFYKDLSKDMKKAFRERNLQKQELINYKPQEAHVSPKSFARDMWN